MAWQNNGLMCMKRANKRRLLWRCVEIRTDYKEYTEQVQSYTPNSLDDKKKFTIPELECHCALNDIPMGFASHGQAE